MWQTTGNATWATISYLSDLLSLFKLSSSLTADLPSVPLSLSLELCSALSLMGFRQVLRLTQKSKWVGETDYPPPLSPPVTTQYTLLQPCYTPTGVPHPNFVSLFFFSSTKHYDYTVDMTWRVHLVKFPISISRTLLEHFVLVIIMECRILINTSGNSIILKLKVLVGSVSAIPPILT